MNPAQRQQEILRIIDEIDDDLLAVLSKRYDVSEMTIRRDLKTLEEAGQIVRTFGGAIRLPPGEHPTSGVPSPWTKRTAIAREKKLSIARYAATHLVDDGGILLLEGGTTVGAMVPHLAAKQDLTVVTTGYYTLGELHRWLPSAATIICSGGTLGKQRFSFVGPVVNRFFSEFHAQRVFLSATGLTLDTGCTDPEMHDIDAKRAMIKSADEVVMLLDSSKFGVKSLMTILPLELVTYLITDTDAPEDMLRAVRRHGVEIHVVPPPDALVTANTPSRPAS